MSILDIKENQTGYKYTKTIIVYVIFSVFAVVVDKVYALFGHGVTSDAMTWMFLYPMIGGAVFYLLLGLLLPKINCFAGYRVLYNLYNSGIALLAVGSLLKGIMEIAGTNSSYLKYYYMFGYGFIAIGLVFLVILVANYKRVDAVKQTVN